MRVDEDYTDVGVDTHDFRLWHFDEIADLMRRKAEAQKPTTNL